MINFNEYQNLTQETAVYPDANRTGVPGIFFMVAIQYCALGLAGEAGETANKVKKMMRDYGDVTDDLRSAVKEELGDTLWYIARLADELHIPLQEIAVSNINKLQSRKERGKLYGSGDDR